MSKILVLHGPNLNLLGTREPDVYGSDTLDAINVRLSAEALELGHNLSFLQSNAESAMIDRIHQSTRDLTDFIIFNPAAWTHTSIALRDALLAVNKPFIEVHLSNIFQRESFRHTSYFSDIAVGCITGLGGKGYSLALQYAHHYLSTRTR
jgi:3-dehydroquinate dehydratase-2